jgi:hypothetical protein
MSDKVVFVRELGKYEVLSKAEFYEKLGIQEICVCQDDLYDTDVLNEISKKAQTKDLSEESLDAFVESLGLNNFLGSIIRAIAEDGSWEAFNDGFNSVVYSSIRFLKVGDDVFASEVFDEEYFSTVDFDVFNLICKNELLGIKEIYIKNW